MLKDRILLTQKFFDLQATPLTLVELQNFLLNEPEVLRQAIDENFEIKQEIALPQQASLEEIRAALSVDLPEQTNDSVYRQHREKLIRRFLPFLRFVPFVRGVAVGGSQTLGSAKKESDIDLLIILDPSFLWLGRIFVTAYFQLTGHRRHGQKIANRFCLNHYLAGPIEVSQERDLYNAMEYLRLRPEVYGQNITKFLENNQHWMRQFFPQAQIPQARNQSQSMIQKFLESLFLNPFGRWLNQRLGQWQMGRIMRGVPAVANQTELSFHSKERKFALLSKLFGP